jgi:hypothetical protein
VTVGSVCARPVDPVEEFAFFFTTRAVRLARHYT